MPDPTSRLYWSGAAGVARCDGVHVDLRQPPAVPRLQLHEIDYVPALQVAQIRRTPADRVDDMTPAEIAAARAWLLGVAAETRDAVEGALTLAIVATRQPRKAAPAEAAR